MRSFATLLVCALLSPQATAFVAPVAKSSMVAPTSRLPATSENNESALPKSSTVAEEEEEELFDMMDFEASFQARLQKEGGLEGLKAKAAERKRDELKQKVTGQLNQWQGDQTILIVCALVLLVVGLAVSTPEPFERSTTTGEQLLFGIRANDW